MIRILMLHGYAQSGHTFAIKTHFLTQQLRAILAKHYQCSEEGIDFVYLDAPFQLDTAEESSLTYTEASSQSPLHTRDQAPPPPSLSSSSPFSINPLATNLGWNPHLDQTDPKTSLTLLSKLSTSQGPFTGVIGFSQGTTLAFMYTSWCEASFNPFRHAALQKMCIDLDDPKLATLLEKPPQSKPLDFAVLLSGRRGTYDCYDGFYEPRLQTPTVHVIGKWDMIVPPWSSEQLFTYCEGGVLIEHEGVHFVPRRREYVEKIADAVGNILGKWEGVHQRSADGSSTTKGRSLAEKALEQHYFLPSTTLAKANDDFRPPHAPQIRTPDPEEMSEVNVNLVLWTMKVAFCQQDASSVSPSNTTKSAAPMTITKGAQRYLDPGSYEAPGNSSCPSLSEGSSGTMTPGSNATVSTHSCSRNTAWYRGYRMMRRSRLTRVTR
jgi:hypothetical protein